MKKTAIFLVLLLLGLLGINLLILVNPVGECDKDLVEKPNTSQVVTLKFWYTENDADKPILLQKIALFQALYPDISIQAQQKGFFGLGDEYMTAFAVGLEPDVIRTPREEIYRFADNNMIAPVTAEWTTFDLNDFLPTSIKVVNYSEEMWGFPQTVDCQMFMINKNLFNQAGFDATQLNWSTSWTWNQFSSNIHLLNQTSGVYALSLAGMFFGARPYFYGQGATFMDPPSEYSVNAIAINNTASRNALMFLKNITDSTYTPPWIEQGWAYFSQDFSDGKLAMIATGPWDIPNLLTNSPQFNGVLFGNDNLGLIKVPHDSSGNYGSVIGGNYYTISSQSTHYNEAVKFIKFMSSNNTMAISAIHNFHVPARKSVMLNTTVQAAPSFRYIQPYFEQARNAFPLEPSKYYTLLEAEFGTRINQYLEGSITLDQCIDLTITQWQSILTPPPEIIINSPRSFQLFGHTAPNYNISITGSYDSIWYTINGGATKVTTDTLTGAINKAEWDNTGNGTVTITFYANNSFNDVSQAEITVHKDIIAPEINIIAPFVGQEFQNAPIFSISIVEANLDYFWYTIDNGENNYTISELTSTINQSAWETVPFGTIHIQFYARDLVGNIGKNTVLISKTLPPRIANIPGFNLIFVISALSIVILLILHKVNTRNSNGV